MLRRSKARVTGFSKKETFNLLRQSMRRCYGNLIMSIHKMMREKNFQTQRNLLYLNVAVCFLKMGDCRKPIEECNKVLDSNPVHVKALYRRGMAHMTAGDFEEARNDFNKMMSSDESSEPTAKAALLKLRKEEQEVHRIARKQFKGLFDNNPGEISEAGVGD